MTTGSRPTACRRCAARCWRRRAIDLRVIAPDGNRSAMARSITTRRPLWVEEVDFGDGTDRLRDRRHPGRLRAAGEPRPDRRLACRRWSSPASTTAPTSATTSPTRARSRQRSRRSCSAFPGSPSRSSRSALELDFRQTTAFDFVAAADFTARLVGDLESVPLPEGTLLNVNFPGCPPEGIAVARLGKRFYRDELELVEPIRAARPPALPRLRRRGHGRRGGARHRHHRDRSRGVWRSRRCTSTSPTTTASRR